jgi:hypothetical protein
MQWMTITAHAAVDATYDCRSYLLWRRQVVEADQRTAQRQARLMDVGLEHEDDARERGTV